METLTPARLIHGSGTPERAWQCWMARYSPPFLALSEMVPAYGAVHIVAPHPDDEVLGCGGIIKQLASLGLPVHIWAVTDGEASHVQTPVRSQAVLADIRTRESLAALSMLNPAAQRTRLGFPDGGVASAQAELADRLAQQFNEGDTVIAPWRLDGHPDHEAACRAAHKAARHRCCRFLEVPIWGWH